MEGYIKFNCKWENINCIRWDQIKSLTAWRQKLHALGLIGEYSDGVGFGNVSQRTEDEQFIISGSKTGSLPTLDEFHFSLVTSFNIDQNLISCRGQTVASSESMSHAIIYRTLPGIRAVFHVHHLPMWELLKDNIPTTDESAFYGSPEMANEIHRLLGRRETLRQKMFVMGGHREGLISFGSTLDEAGQVLIDEISSIANSI